MIYERSKRNVESSSHVYKYGVPLPRRIKKIRNGDNTSANTNANTGDYSFTASVLATMMQGIQL